MPRLQRTRHHQLNLYNEKPPCVPVEAFFFGIGYNIVMIRRGLNILWPSSLLVVSFLIWPNNVYAQALPTPENLKVERTQNGKVQLSWEIATNRAITVDQRTQAVLPNFYQLKIKSSQAAAGAYDLIHHKNDSYIATLGLIGYSTKNINSSQSAQWTFDNGKQLRVTPNSYKANLRRNELTAAKISFTFVDNRQNYDSLAPSVFLEVSTGSISQVETSYSSPARINKRVSEGEPLTGGTDFFNQTNLTNYTQNKVAPYQDPLKIKTTDESAGIITITQDNPYSASFADVRSTPEANTTRKSIENFRSFAPESKNKDSLKKLLSGDPNPFEDQVVSSSDLNTIYQSFFLNVLTSSDPGTFRAKLQDIRANYLRLFGSEVGDRVLRDVFAEFLVGHRIETCDDLVQALAVKAGKIEAYGLLDYALLGVAGAGTGFVVGGPVGAVVGAAGLPTGHRALQTIEASSLSEEGKSKIKEFLRESALLRMKIRYLALAELARGLKQYQNAGNDLPQGVGLNPHKMFLLESEINLIQDRLTDCIKAAQRYLGKLDEFAQGKDCPINLPLGLGNAVCAMANFVLAWSISLTEFSFGLLLKATTLTQ